MRNLFFWYVQLFLLADEPISLVSYYLLGKCPFYRKNCFACYFSHEFFIRKEAAPPKNKSRNPSLSISPLARSLLLPPGRRHSRGGGRGAAGVRERTWTGQKGMFSFHTDHPEREKKNYVYYLEPFSTLFAATAAAVVEGLGF